MTRDDILRMAREAGFRAGYIEPYNSDPMPFVAPCSATDCTPELVRFAAIVAAAEREACAQPHPAEPAAEEDDGLYWRLHAMSKSLEGAGLIDEHESPDAYAAVLDAMAFVQQHESCATPPDRAKWYFKQVEPSGTVVARDPRGAEFVVKDGRFDTAAGRELLNAMIAALSGR